MLGTMAANLLLQSLSKRLAHPLAMDEEKRLLDERATVSDLTTLSKVLDLSWLNDIPGFIEDLQAEIVIDIPW